MPSLVSPYTGDLHPPATPAPAVAKRKKGKTAAVGRKKPKTAAKERVSVAGRGEHETVFAASLEAQQVLDDDTARKERRQMLVKHHSDPKYVGSAGCNERICPVHKCEDIVVRSHETLALHLQEQHLNVLPSEEMLAKCPRLQCVVQLGRAGLIDHLLEHMAPPVPGKATCQYCQAECADESTVRNHHRNGVCLPCTCGELFETHIDRYHHEVAKDDPEKHRGGTRGTRRSVPKYLEGTVVHANAIRG
jgi:hypothetical protein